MNWHDFFMGVASSVVASIIITIVVAIVHRTKSTAIIKCRKAIKRVMETHMTDFYYNRDTLNNDMGSINQFLKKTKYEIYHIGFWLSNTLDNQDLGSILKQQICNGIKVNICLLNPQSPLITYYADFMGYNVDDIKNKINATINTLTQVRRDLPNNLQENFKLYSHDKINTTSIWALDINSDTSYIFIDHKLYNVNRFNTYGFEILSKGNCKGDDSFGNILCSNVNSIIKSSHIIF